MKKRMTVILAFILILAIFPIPVLAAQNYVEYTLYVERPASAAGNYYYHGAKYEPVTGTYLGMFAEGDAQMHDWNSPSADYWYFGGTPRLRAGARLGLRL